jgi:hypothetical protein
VVACGRRFGKTTLGIDLACETALGDEDSPARPVGWFAPEYKLLSEAWRDLRDILAPVIARANDQERRIELNTGGTIEAWSFDRNPNAGRSRKYQRVVIDEAAHCRRLEEVWTKAVRPTLTDYRGDAWFLSSPNGKDYFHTLWRKGLSAEGPWKSWRMTSYDNPHLDPAEIDAARADLGDRFFAQEYLAEFLDDLRSVVIPGDWLDLAASAQHVPAGPRRIAVDLAEGRGDPAGYLVRDDNGIYEAKVARWTLEQAATAVALACQRHRIAPSRITYDAGGVGADFANRLKAVGLDGAMAYKGGFSGGRSFANLRTAGAWAARQRLDPLGTVAGPYGRPVPQTPFAIPPSVLTAMRPELQALTYTIEADRTKALEPKEVMSASLGHSPTYADLLIMSFAFPSM